MRNISPLPLVVTKQEAENMCLSLSLSLNEAESTYAGICVPLGAWSQSGRGKDSSKWLT